MKVHISYIFSILILCSSALHSQNNTIPEENNPRNYQNMVFIEGGYTTFDLPLMKKSIDNIVGSVSSNYNINAMGLLRFPNNWYIGSSYLVRTSDFVRLNIGGYFTQTRGFVGYRDVHGDFVDDMHVNIFFLRLGFQIDVVHSHALTLYVSPQVGVLYSTIRDEARITFYQLHEYDSSSSTLSKAYFLTGALHFGAYTPIFGLIFSLECGYRFNKENKTGDFNDSFNGWIFSSRVGFPW
jgi:hypothetical protein